MIELIYLGVGLGIGFTTYPILNAVKKYYSKCAYCGYKMGSEKKYGRISEILDDGKVHFHYICWKKYTNDNNLVGGKYECQKK